MSQFYAQSTAAGLGAIISVTTDDANVVIPDGAGNINLVGAHGLNTSGAVANTASVQIDNAITLGDLAVLTAATDALTVTSGDITISGTGATAGGNLTIPRTLVTTGAKGVFTLGVATRFHVFGDFTSGQTSLYMGATAGNFTNTGGSNTGIGGSALTALTSGNLNSAYGSSSLSSLTTGSHNTAIGSGTQDRGNTGSRNTSVGMQALGSALGVLGYNFTGSENVAVGRSSMLYASSASYNVAVGSGENLAGNIRGPLYQLLTGNYNIAIGSSILATAGTGAGAAYTGAESSNICIGPRTIGTAAESNVMRLGTTGAGDGQVNIAFVAGTYGITPASAGIRPMVMDDAGQQGTQTTLGVVQGGTARASHTAYAVICGGTTATAAQQSIASVGSATEVLTSNGAGALPTFQAAAGGGLTWTAPTGATQAMAVSNGYFANRNGADLAFTLPATAAIGETMEIALMHATGTWSLAQNAGQTCYIGNTNTTTGVGGNLASSDKGDWIEIICRVADTDFQVNVKSGNVTVV